MKEPVWNKFLIERDKELWDAAGYGTRQGFGERPVILVVDVNYAFTGDRRESILESIKRWPNSCGEDAWNAMRYIKRLLDAARAKGLPVIYTTNDWRPDGWDAASWRWKGRRPREMHPQAEANKSILDGNEINPEIAPEPQDIIIRKLKPSGFHGTPLTSLLTNFKADSLIVVGTSTSGCVRASVIDAFSENYRVAVVEEGCFDRFWTSHAMSLCDIHAKYGDVIGIDEAVAFIEGLVDDLFDLPNGTPPPLLAARSRRDQGTTAADSRLSRVRPESGEAGKPIETPDRSTPTVWSPEGQRVPNALKYTATCRLFGRLLQETISGGV